jgi:hypothetical protein
LILAIKPARDKGIFANHVILKAYVIEIIRSELRGIYEMERGTTEVGFEHDLEPLKFGSLTKDVEIKRM